MKYIELIGTLCAALGFLLLSENYLLYGFIFGILSCVALLPVLYKNKLIPLFYLQLFFASVNINGILNNIGL